MCSTNWLLLLAGIRRVFSETALLLTDYAVPCEMLFWERIMTRVTGLVPSLFVLVLWEHLHCQGEREMLFAVLRRAEQKERRAAILCGELRLH